MKAIRFLRNITIGVFMLAEVGGACCAGESRTWTSADGKHKVEAELLNVDDQQIRIRKSDGTVVSVPLAKISTSDQEYAKKTKQNASSNRGAARPPSSAGGKVTSRGRKAGMPTRASGDEMRKLRDLGLKPGKTYEIGLRGTLRLRGPLEWYQIRGVIKEITPEQAVILEVRAEEGKDARLISCPAGTVQSIFLGHESECECQHRVNGNAVPGYSDLKRFGRQYDYRWLEWSDECRSFVADSGRVEGLDRFPSFQLGGVFNETAEEVIEHWKSKGDKEACAIVYTWTDEDARHMQDVANEPGKPFLQRLFETWENATPEQKEFIKGMGAEGVTLAAKMVEISKKGAVSSSSGAQPQRNASRSNAPQEGERRVTMTGRVVPRDRLARWAYFDLSPITIYDAADKRSDGTFSFQCLAGRRIWISVDGKKVWDGRPEKDTDVGVIP